MVTYSSAAVFGSEAIGTCVAIYLGEAIIANELLSKTKVGRAAAESCRHVLAAPALTRHCCSWAAGPGDGVGLCGPGLWIGLRRGN
jgi:hypothetical protein